LLTSLTEVPLAQPDATTPVPFSDTKEDDELVFTAKVWCTPFVDRHSPSTFSDSDLSSAESYTSDFDDSSFDSADPDDDLYFIEEFSENHEPYGLPVSSNSSLSTTNFFSLHPFQDVLDTLEPELLEYVPNIEVIPVDRAHPVALENHPVPPL